MSHPASRSATVALTSAALLGLSAFAIPGTAGAVDSTCDAADTTYAVTGGSIQWGVKESFRNYLTGNIAQGGWTLGEGVQYMGSEAGDDGAFVWPIAEGTTDGQDAATASGDGTVTFEGHHGALETTLSNPSVTIDGTEGSLALDYHGKELNTNPDAEPVWLEDTQATAVDFAVTPADLSEGSVTITADAPTLNAEFVDALGSYDAGSAMDPVTIVLDITASCEPGDGEGDDEGTGETGGIFGSLGILFGSLGF